MLTYVIFGIIGGIFIIAVVAAVNEKKKLAGLPQKYRQMYMEEQRASELTRAYGPVNTAMICPHCQAIGQIRAKQVDRETGIDSGKALAAWMTKGFSVFFAGLAQTERFTSAHCDHCGNSWLF